MPSGINTIAVSGLWFLEIFCVAFSNVCPSSMYGFYLPPQYLYAFYFCNFKFGFLSSWDLAKLKKLNAETLYGAQK